MAKKSKKKPTPVKETKPVEVKVKQDGRKGHVYSETCSCARCKRQKEKTERVALEEKAIIDKYLAAHPELTKSNERPEFDPKQVDKALMQKEFYDQMLKGEIGTPDILKAKIIDEYLANVKPGEIPEPAKSIIAKEVEGYMKEGKEQLLQEYLKELPESKFMIDLSDQTMDEMQKVVPKLQKLYPPDLEQNRNRNSFLNIICNEALRKYCNSLA